LDALLDASLVVHVGTTTPRGPLVLPMAFGRVGDRLYLHGARSNGLLSALCDSTPACITATAIDGLVVARSAFHHSMNYRSAVIFGVLTEVTDPDEQNRALTAILEHALPGRAAETRLPSPREIRATLVLSLSLEEASLKVRSGPEVDAHEDLDLPHWAGVLPSRFVLDPPAPGGAPTCSALPSSVLRALLATAPRLRIDRTHGEFAIDSDPRRLDFERIHVWLSNESYWAQGVTREQLIRRVSGSFVVGAYDSADAQVAFARVVTDRSSFAWLCDVFVDSSYRGLGLGRAVVTSLLEAEELGGIRRWCLGTRDAHAMYSTLGFEPVPDNLFMQRMMRPPP
jgi:hypothetical protein